MNQFWYGCIMFVLGFFFALWCASNGIVEGV